MVVPISETMCVSRVIAYMRNLSACTQIIVRPDTRERDSARGLCLFKWSRMRWIALQHRDDDGDGLLFVDQMNLYEHLSVHI